MAPRFFSHKAYEQIYEQAYEKQYLKSAILDYPPLWLTLGICSPCAYRCDFCAYHSLDARKISKVYNVKFKMPLEQAKRIIDFAHRGDVQKIHVCATGEPLWHPDFFSILDYVIEQFGSVSFQSNFPADLVSERNAVKNILDRKNCISGITVDLMGNSRVKGGDKEALYETLSQIISVPAAPRIGGTFLLSRTNWQNLETVVRDLHAHKLDISVRTAIVFPYGMNTFTDPSNTWTRDKITPEEKAGLAEIQTLAESLGVRMYLLSEQNSVCDAFWKKLQVWPTQGSAPGRLDNLVPHACNAVVLGDMASVGYLEDYEDMHSLWNNPCLIEIRQKLLSGICPDSHCSMCPIRGSIKCSQ